MAAGFLSLGVIRLSCFYADPNAVLIAVGAHFHDLLRQAAGCALVPYFLAAAGPVISLSCFYAFFKRLGVHIGEHEHFSGGYAGRYAWN